MQLMCGIVLWIVGKAPRRNDLLLDPREKLPHQNKKVRERGFPSLGPLALGTTPYKAPFIKIENLGVVMHVVIQS